LFGKRDRRCLQSNARPTRFPARSSSEGVDLQTVVTPASTARPGVKRQRVFPDLRSTSFPRLRHLARSPAVGAQATHSPGTQGSPRLKASVVPANGRCQAPNLRIKWRSIGGVPTLKMLPKAFLKRRFIGICPLAVDHQRVLLGLLNVRPGIARVARGPRFDAPWVEQPRSAVL